MNSVAIVFGICLMAAICAASPPETIPTLSSGSNSMQWTHFQSQHNRYYPTSLEAGKRSQIFERNTRDIRQHNRLFEAGAVSFRQQINPFADLSSAEFLSQRGAFNMSVEEDELPNAELPLLGATDPLPWSVNWVEKGAVTEVQNQGSCGSCWAFAMTGALEAWHWRKTGQLVPLSQQQVLDCTGRGNTCVGGWPSQAFDYARMNYGLSPASAYPYLGRLGQCYNVYRVATLGSFARTAAGSEKDLMRAVALFGPVSVVFQMVPSSFQFYGGGVYQEPRCSRGVINHAMLVVGYGYDEGSQLYYWLVKNSWGPQWGEGGYVRVKRYAQGTESCSIAAGAVYVTA